MVGSPISLLGIVNPNEIQSALNSLIIQLNEIFNSETSEASLTVANLTVSQSLMANVSGNIALNATGTVSLSPTGALTINPTAASAIDNCTLGVTVPLAVKSTTLTATGAVALSPTGANVVLSPTGSGVVTVNPATAGTINNCSLGATTPLAITGTVVTANTTLAVGGATLSTFGPASNQGSALQTNVTSGFPVFQNRFSNDASGSVLAFHKSRGTTIGTNTIVTTGDQIGQLIFRGADGTNYPNTAGILVTCAGTIGTGQVPGVMALQTATAGGTLTTALTLDQAQGALFAGTVTVPGVTTPLLSTTGTITTGAGAQVGTLTNSPTAGNPTKWWPINDNGTTRYVPAW